MKQNTKDWIQYGSAIALILSGVALVFLSFLLTLDVNAGVNTYAGVAFSCALAIFGVSAYMVSQVASFKTQMRNDFDDLRNELTTQKPHDTVHPNQRQPHPGDSPKG